MVVIEPGIVLANSTNSMYAFAVGIVAVVVFVIVLGILKNRKAMKK